MSTDGGHTTAPDERIGRLLNGYLDRRERGVAEPEHEFLAANSEFADALRDHLALLRQLPTRQANIERLIASGILERGAGEGFAARFGDYRIRGVLGEGAAGVVLEAWDPVLRREVAVKVLRPEYSGDSLALARFVREARSAAALNHPNVVSVHTVGHINGTHYLTLEYVAGPSLARVIATHGPLPAGLVRHLFRQLLEGLSVAHDAGLIHRDIKPSNLLLSCDPFGREPPASAPKSHPVSLPSLAVLPILKIADFGLARMADAQTLVTQHAGAVLGTPHYMSPEQARGDRDIDHRTDPPASTPLATMLANAIACRVFHGFLLASGDLSMCGESGSGAKTPTPHPLTTKPSARTLPVRRPSGRGGSECGRRLPSWRGGGRSPTRCVPPGNAYARRRAGPG